GARAMVEPLAEGEGIVSKRFVKNVTLQVANPGSVSRVIGLDRKAIHRGSGVGLHGGADAMPPTAGALPPPRRSDDPYRFGSPSCLERRRASKAARYGAAGVTAARGRGA